MVEPDCEEALSQQVVREGEAEGELFYFSNLELSGRIMPESEFCVRMRTLGGNSVT